MKFQRSRTFAEHKLIQRIVRALLSLLLLPLAGIVVGAVFWWNLERGLLLFNLLGVALFAAITYPFWRGERQKKRRLQLLFSGGSVLLSTLVSVFFDHVVAAYALYFAVACEAFSLIPWIVEVVQEIRRGDWQDWQPPPPLFRRSHREPYDQRMQRSREETPPWDSPASRRDEVPRQGPELPPPPPPWKLLLPLLLAALAVSALWLWQDGTPYLFDGWNTYIHQMGPEREHTGGPSGFPTSGQVEQVLEERYGEPFQLDCVFYEDEGLRTWWAFPENDAGLRFTVATGPAAVDGEEQEPFAPAVGKDNYSAHAWNARVVPILHSHGMEELSLSITSQDLAWGSCGGLLLPEPFASEFPSVYTGSTMVGWYMLPMCYWAGEETDWPDAVRELSALLRELRPIAPFSHLGSWQEELDDSLQSVSWHDWILPVAVKEGFVGIPIARPCTRDELLTLLEDSRPHRYYYIEDGLICRPSTFDPATPVFVPEGPSGFSPVMSDRDTPAGGGAEGPLPAETPSGGAGYLDLG